MSHWSTTTVPAAQCAGRIIVGDRGGLSAVTGTVEPSSLMAGMVAAETEHGTLYLDADEPVTVLRGRVLARPLTAQRVDEHRSGAVIAFAVEVEDGDFRADAEGATLRACGLADLAGHSLLWVEHAIVGRGPRGVLVAVRAQLERLR